MSGSDLLAWLGGGLVIATLSCMPRDACLRHSDCELGRCVEGRCEGEGGAGGAGGEGGLDPIGGAGGSP